MKSLKLSILSAASNSSRFTSVLWASTFLDVFFSFLVQSSWSSDLFPIWKSSHDKSTLVGVSHRLPVEISSKLNRIIFPSFSSYLKFQRDGGFSKVNMTIILEIMFVCEVQATNNGMLLGFIWGSYEDSYVQMLEPFFSHFTIFFGNQVLRCFHRLVSDARAILHHANSSHFVFKEVQIEFEIKLSQIYQQVRELFTRSCWRFFWLKQNKRRAASGEGFLHAARRSTFVYLIRNIFNNFSSIVLCLNSWAG